MRIIHRLLAQRAHLLKQEKVFIEFINSFKEHVEQYIQKYPVLVRFETDLGDSTYRITLLRTYLRFAEYIHPLNQF